MTQRDASSALQAAERKLRLAEAGAAKARQERDALLLRAVSDGALSQADAARLLGLTRGRVAQILAPFGRVVPRWEPTQTATRISSRRQGK